MNPELPDPRAIVIPPLASFPSRDEWIQAHFDAYLVDESISPPGIRRASVQYQGPPECLPLVRKAWQDKMLKLHSVDPDDAWFFTRWPSPELVAHKTRPGRSEQQFGRSSAFTSATVPEGDTFPSLASWHEALLTAYLYNEQFNADHTCVQVNYRGPAQTMGLVWDLWQAKMEAQGFKWPDNLMFLEPVPDQSATLDPEFIARQEAAARKEREAATLERAKREALKTAGVATSQDLSRQTLAALARWSKEREIFAAGHLVHRVDGRFTVQVVTSSGDLVPLEEGPSFPSIGALRMAIARGKVNGLPRVPAVRPKKRPAGAKAPGSFLD